MSVEQDFADKLLDDATIAAAIGTRMYALVAPADTATPYCVYHVASRAFEYTHSGRSPTEQYTIRVGCYDSYAGSGTYAKVRAIADAIADVASGVRTTWGETVVNSAFVSSMADVIEADPETQTMSVIGRTVDIQLRVQRQS